LVYVRRAEELRAWLRRSLLWFAVFEFFRVVYSLFYDDLDDFLLLFFLLTTKLQVLRIVFSVLRLRLWFNFIFWYIFFLSLFREKGPKELCQWFLK